MLEKNEQKSLLSQISRIVFAVVLSVLILTPASFAADYSNSLAAFPGGNPAPLVNLSATTQTKVGDFWADAVGAADRFCIGGSCITSWPWTVQPATCQLNVMIKQGQSPGGASPVGSGCVLSASEIAAGWIPMSWAYCSWVSSADCAGWKYCTYSRLACSGSVLVTPGTIYRGSPYYTQGYYQSSYQSSYTCFSPDTLISMADGSQKKITAVAVGEYVLSADEVTGAHTVSMVTKTFEHVGSYETLLVNDIVVTPEHKFKVVRDGNELWLPASDILVGDSLIARDGNIPVTSVAPNQSLSAVYNLTTVPSHTYYADGVLVHNIKAGGGGFNPDP